MKHVPHATALAFGVVWSLALAAPATGQDAETLKPFREKSMIQIEYKEPTATRLKPIYERLKDRQVLERLQAFLSPLRLPAPLTVMTAECGGQLELPYRSDAPVTLCYEYVALIEQQAPPANDPIGAVGAALVTRDIALVGPFVQLTLHGVARNIIDMLELPVWGNAEDAADSLAAFIALEVSPQVAQKVIFGTAYFFSKAAESERVDFAAVRPHVAQRYFNLLCIAVGSDLVRYSVFIPATRQPGAGDLPKNRLPFCLQLSSPSHSEYNKIKYAFEELILKKYVDLPLMAQVRAVEWLKND